MKKIFSLFFILMLTLSLPINIAFAANDSGYDFSEWTDEQITDLFAQVKVEMNKRGLAQAKELSPKDMTQSEMTLKKGMYVVGEDIQAGSYKITCIETEGEQLNGLYSSLGNAYSSFEGNDSWGALFGSLGDIVEKVSPATIQIVGDYGKVIKSFDLDKGSSASLSLSEKTALKIEGGTCTLELR